MSLLIFAAMQVAFNELVPLVRSQLLVDATSIGAWLLAPAQQCLRPGFKRARGAWEAGAGARGREAVQLLGPGALRGRNASEERSYRSDRRAM